MSKKLTTAEIKANVLAKAAAAGATEAEKEIIAQVADATVDGIEARDAETINDLGKTVRKGKGAASVAEAAMVKWVEERVAEADRSPIVRMCLQLLAFLCAGALLSFVAYTGATWLAGGLLWLTGNVVLAKIALVAAGVVLVAYLVYAAYKFFTGGSSTRLSRAADTVSTLGAAAFTRMAEFFDEDEVAHA